MTFTIEHIDHSAIPDLIKVGVKTFEEAFLEENNQEDIQKYIETSFSESLLLQEFSNPNSSFYFIKVQGNIAGYLKMNDGPAQTELKSDESIEIERIYILKDYYGLGIGQALLNKAFSIAIEKSKKFIWLGVWEHNDRAIRFYKKNGFEPFSEHVFMLGNDKQIDVMMKKELKH